MGIDYVGQNRMSKPQVEAGNRRTSSNSSLRGAEEVKSVAQDISEFIQLEFEKIAQRKDQNENQNPPNCKK